MQGNLLTNNDLNVPRVATDDDGMLGDGGWLTLHPGDDQYDPWLPFVEPAQRGTPLNDGHHLVVDRQYQAAGVVLGAIDPATLTVADRHRLSVLLGYLDQF